MIYNTAEHIMRFYFYLLVFVCVFLLFFCDSLSTVHFILGTSLLKPLDCFVPLLTSVRLFFFLLRGIFSFEMIRKQYFCTVVRICILLRVTVT
ncbi:hypothetical protein GDO78_009965 [Eleutherodactylus coqui]|uniref:Uncharacterized protein n=1 Tax=Eleutherodactylus coqui TaxID=57060 RepID=A0A8J6FC49_ELECQ|nr:hypothetical protein GDO78_009965 [Eleutherodactylus coqui]